MANTHLRLPNSTSASAIAEGFFLPLSAALASAGFASVCLRSILLASGLATGRLPYVLICLGAATGAAATVINRVFNLPIMLRAADFFSIHILSATMLTAAPYARGALRLGHEVVSVTLPPTGVSAVFLAWTMASSLSMVIVKVYPFLTQRPRELSLAERLAEEGRLREVYIGGEYSRLAQLFSLHSAYKVILTFITVYLIFTLLWPQGSAQRTDEQLATWSAVTFGGVMAYLAFTHLAGKRRNVEQQGISLIPPLYESAWALGVWLPVVAATSLGCWLPENISPLASVDYNAIMDNLTRWVGGLLSSVKSSSNTAGFYITPRLGSIGVGGYMPSAFGLVYLLYYLGLFCAVAAIVWMAIKHFWQEDSLNRKDLLSILVAILLWPFQALASLFHVVCREIKEARQKDRSSKDSATKERRARRLKRWMYPNDPAVFVRFIYGRFLHNAAQAGIQRSREQTALEYARSVAVRLPESDVSVEELTQIYCDVKYTAHILQPSVKARTMKLLHNVQRNINNARRARGRAND